MQDRPRKTRAGMKYLLKEWKTIKRALEKKYIYLFLDFDGTLTRIRKRPGSVKLSKATKSVLKDLASQKKISIAIISGRSLKDARRMVGLKSLIYAGNHGLEAEGPGLKHAVPEALRAKKAIKEISAKLKKQLKALRGVIVEDKGLTLSVHYRMVPAGKVKEAEKIFKKVVLAHKSSGKVVVTSGKKVWEVRPPVKWNKGKAAAHLLKRKKKTLKKGVASFYVGDDITDEDAFRILRKSSYTVKVGKKASSAKYYVYNIKEVGDFLKKLLAVKRKESHV